MLWINDRRRLPVFGKVRYKPRTLLGPKLGPDAGVNYGERHSQAVVIGSPGRQGPGPAQ